MNPTTAAPALDAPSAPSAGWYLWDLPFFEQRHHELAGRLAGWPAGDEAAEHADMAGTCRRLAREFGRLGLLDYVVPRRQADGTYAPIEVRSLSVIREALGYHHILADAVFAMQGIGTGAIWMHGSDYLKDRYLEPCRTGEKVAAFALSEPEAGSDVASMTTSARRDGDHYVINGTKTWITNAGFADHYVVVARTGEAPGARGLSAFMVDADTPGLTIGDPIELIAPHPAASLTFEDCRIPASHLIGQAGNGFKVAMSVFDIFRTSVGGAAVGVARRALDETLGRVTQRRIYGKLMSEMEGVQFKLADMASDIECSALAVYRAGWMKDVRGVRGTREASMAKLVATEAANRVVDSALQLFGGMGVTKGNIIEQLYREVRPMRLYEGASEVQKLIIARNLLAEAASSRGG